MPASRPRLILGMSSGTSADAVDLALVKITGSRQERKIEVLEAMEMPFEPALQQRVHAFIQKYDLPLAQLDRDISFFFSDCANIFLEKFGYLNSDLDCIASHGQTVFHHDGDPTQGSLQLGDIQLMADRCGAPVIGNFRQADLHQGGQGAPISVFADWVLHGEIEDTVAILNLGGIANISLLRLSQPPMAWDCGPANGPLDALIRKNSAEKCDLGGEIALSGKRDQNLFEELVQHPYFSAELPKSTGLELFGPKWVDDICDRFPDVSLEDMLATLCGIVGYSVSSSLKMAPEYPRFIYCCGGGRHNLALMCALRAALPDVVIRDYSELGFDADLREAMAFALLGDAFLLGEVSTWPTTTGGKKSSILGNVVHPCT